jgi:hypothetical protein
VPALRIASVFMAFMPPAEPQRANAAKRPGATMIVSKLEAPSAFLMAVFVLRNVWTKGESVLPTLLWCLLPFSRSSR